MPAGQQPHPRGGPLQLLHDGRGLALQSLHDGRQWVHEPLRLSVFIEAPAEAIDNVIAGKKLNSRRMSKSDSDELVEPGRSVEHRELGVDVEVGEGVGHGSLAGGITGVWFDSP